VACMRRQSAFRRPATLPLRKTRRL
jgi:hypothetical protein